MVQSTELILSIFQWICDLGQNKQNIYSSWLSSQSNIPIIFSYTQGVQVWLGPSILYPNFRWVERNRLLHDTNTIDGSLELSIDIELDRGFWALQRFIYSNHFRLDPNTIKDLSTETKPEWILLILSDREANIHPQRHLVSIQHRLWYHAQTPFI